MVWWIFQAGGKEQVTCSAVMMGDWWTKQYRHPTLQSHIVGLSASSARLLPSQTVKGDVYQKVRVTCYCLDYVGTVLIAICGHEVCWGHYNYVENCMSTWASASCKFQKFCNILGNSGHRKLVWWTGKKSKASLHIVRAYWGMEVWLHSFLTSALEGSKWSASSPCHVTPVGRALCTYLIWGLVEPTAIVNVLEKRQISCPAVNWATVVELCQLVLKVRHKHCVSGKAGYCKNTYRGENPVFQTFWARK